MQSVREFIIL